MVTPGGGEPLPARTCSRCVNWLARIYGTEEKDGILRAVCEIHSKQTSGGETCGQWRRELT